MYSVHYTLYDSSSVSIVYSVHYTLYDSSSVNIVYSVHYTLYDSSSVSMPILDNTNLVEGQGLVQLDEQKGTISPASHNNGLLAIP